MKEPHGSICDVFLKVGGSILDNSTHTSALADTLTSLSDSGLRIVILTGGGRIAKRIKANQTQLGCDFERCWRATTLALDVNAGLLASYSSRFRVSNCIGQIVSTFQSGHIPIFAPAEALFGSLWFIPNWVVTTDTMGLYFSHMMGARRYVIVTDVDGIFPRKPSDGVGVGVIPKLPVAELEKLPSSKLDAAFPAFFRKYPIETLVVNGKYPGRVLAAISGRSISGTEITRDTAAIVASPGHGSRMRGDSGIQTGGTPTAAVS